MKGLDIDVDKYSLKSLLQHYGQFKVPPFQRPYSWDMKHWSQLWDDLRENRDDDYLLGNIVLCGSDEEHELVIDGQQRLSTITIMAAAIRDYAFKQFCEDRKANELCLEIQTHLIVSGGVLDEAKPFLLLGDDDHEWFADRIQVPPGRTGDYQPPISGKIPYKIPSSNRLLWRCYRFYFDQLTKEFHGKSADEQLTGIMQISRQLANKVWLVVTRVPSDSSAYTLFEVLNDRGLDLSIADLFKNVVFSRAITHGKFKYAKRIWQEISDGIGHENISSFLRYHWMSQNGEKITEKKLFTCLKDYIDGLGKEEFAAYLKSLSAEAESYGEIAGLNNPDDEDVREALESLRAFGFSIVNPLLLAAWHVTEEPQKRCEIAEMAEAFMVRYATFAGQATNRLEGVFSELAKKLREQGIVGLPGIRSDLKKELPDAKQVREGFSVLEPSPAIARAILAKIERSLGPKEKGILSSSKVHVEHIFPQSPTEEWLKAFGAEDGTEESFCKRLGNLTLIAKKLNQEASNRLFAQKAKKYYSASDFRITKQLAEHKDWTYERVDGRQAKLRDAAEKIWAL